MASNEIYAAVSQAQGGRFFGKYRGEVVANSDSAGRGRLQVMVPEVLGENVVVWALPCAPFAGSGVGFHAMPPVGANIWVEFEAGNLRYPIWSGCFWADGEIDSADAKPEIVFLRTDKAVIRIDDAASEVKIEIGSAKITLTTSEVTIEAPTITNNANGGKTELTAGGFDAQQGAFKVV